MGFAKHIDSTRRFKLTLFLALFFIGVGKVSGADPEHELSDIDMPLFDTDSFFAVNHYHQRSVKPVVNWSLPVNLWQKTMTVETKFIETPEGPAKPGVLGVASHQRSLLKLQMAAPIFDNLLSSEGEYSYSFLSHQVQDGLGNPQNRLARLRFSGDWRNVEYGAEFRSVGKNFVNIGGRRMTPDREGGEIWAEGKFGILKLRAAMGSFWDNLEHDPARMQVTRSHGKLTAHFNRAPWPAFKLAYTRIAESSGREPRGVAPLNRWIDAWEASVEKKIQNWRTTLTSFLSINQDRLNRQDTNTVHRHRFAASYRPTKTFEFTPSFTWEEIDDPTNPRSVSTIGIFNRFHDPKLGLNWTATALFNRRFATLTADNSREIRLKSSLNWSLKDGELNPRSVSLLFDYRRENHETAGKSENFSVWLAVKFRPF